MPDQTSAHIMRMTQQSAVVRRARLIERLIASAPPFSDEQKARFCQLLNVRPGVEEADAVNPTSRGFIDAGVRALP
jgi:hypothetical protein